MFPRNHCVFRRWRVFLPRGCHGDAFNQALRALVNFSVLALLNDLEEGYDFESGKSDGR